MRGDNRVRIIKALAIALALTPSPSLGAGFALPIIPQVVPDIGCVVGFFLGGGHCITATFTTAYAAVNSEMMQIQNMTTMNATGLLQNIAGRIASVTQTAQ